MDDQLTDELVKNVDRFSSPCVRRDTVMTSVHFFGKITLPAASTQRWVVEKLSDELAEYCD